MGWKQMHKNYLAVRTAKTISWTKVSWQCRSFTRATFEHNISQAPPEQERDAVIQMRKDARRSEFPVIHTDSVIASGFRFGTDPDDMDMQEVDIENGSTESVIDQGTVRMVANAGQETGSGLPLQADSWEKMVQFMKSLVSQGKKKSDTRLCFNKQNMPCYHENIFDLLLLALPVVF